MAFYSAQHLVINCVMKFVEMYAYLVTYYPNTFRNKSFSMKGIYELTYNFRICVQQITELL